MSYSDLSVTYSSVCAAPKGRGFAPFWSENGHIDFAHFGIGYGFQGNYGSVRTYLLFQFLMS